MKKRLSCIILTLVMIISLVPFAAAASDEATEAAEALYELGLFKGTGTNPDGTPIFDLDKTPTRNQAIIMLVRLLGKEDEALAGTWSIPFTDVSDNMKPYIGYAYANGLTNGTSATTYSGTNPIKANQYITFVLRAMGYTSGEDFQVSTAWEFSDKIGLTDGRYHENTDTFLRSDIAIISAFALKTGMKDTENTLFEYLKENGTLKQDASLAIEWQEVKFYYFNNDGYVKYDDDYVRSARAAKIGEHYRFEIGLKTNYFVECSFFPETYGEKDTHPAGYGRLIYIEERNGNDMAIFSVSEEFLFLNPISTRAMVLKLMPNFSMFPADFEFQQAIVDGRVLEERIMVEIPTKQLRNW